MCGEAAGKHGGVCPPVLCTASRPTHKVSASPAAPARPPTRLSASLLPAANGAVALLSGVLRGCGRQKIGAITNAAANYGVGLPLQLLFAFRLGAGVEGLWWGITAASALQGAVLAAQVSRFDWRREAGRAAKLVRHLSGAAIGAAAGRGLQEAVALERPSGVEGGLLGCPPML